MQSRFSLYLANGTHLLCKGNATTIVTYAGSPNPLFVFERLSVAHKYGTITFNNGDANCVLSLVLPPRQTSKPIGNAAHARKALSATSMLTMMANMWGDATGKAQPIIDSTAGLPSRWPEATRRYLLPVSISTLNSIISADSRVHSQKIAASGPSNRQCQSDHAGGEPASPKPDWQWI